MWAARKCFNALHSLRRCWLKILIDTQWDDRVDSSFEEVWALSYWLGELSVDKITFVCFLEKTDLCLCSGVLYILSKNVKHVPIVVFKEVSGRDLLFKKLSSACQSLSSLVSVTKATKWYPSPCPGPFLTAAQQQVKPLSSLSSQVRAGLFLQEEIRLD